MTPHFPLFRSRQILGASRVGLIFSSLLFSSCTFIPSSGPSFRGIENDASTSSHAGNYYLVSTTQELVKKLNQQPPHPSSLVPLSDLHPDLSSLSAIDADEIQRIKPGDVLAVAIFSPGGGFSNQSAGESASGSPGGGENSALSLPPQLVDLSGTVSVPSGGKVKVKGLTPAEAADAIAQVLQGKIYLPSVIVTLQDRKGSDLITVTGDVRTPSRVPIPLSGLRLVDALAGAGGSQGKEYETSIILIRGNQIVESSYRDILQQPEKNVWLQIGDTVLVKVRPWSYTLLGATGQSLHPFPTEHITVDQALASGNGLNDNQANPAAVFIYRFEDEQTLQQLLPQSSPPAAGKEVPVIYRINFRDADGLFIAQSFQIRDHDLIFVPNAGSVGWLKAINLIGSFTSPALSGASGAAAIGTIK